MSRFPPRIHFLCLRCCCCSSCSQPGARRLPVWHWLAGVEFVWGKQIKVVFQFTSYSLRQRCRVFLLILVGLQAQWIEYFKKEVPAELDTLRADKVAASLFSDFSRNELAHWIKMGDLSINGGWKSQRQAFRGGCIDLDVIVKTEEWHKPENLDLDVVYKDEDVLVLNKPPVW